MTSIEIETQPLGSLLAGLRERGSESLRGSLGHVERRVIGPWLVLFENHPEVAHSREDDPIDFYSCDVRSADMERRRRCAVCPVDQSTVGDEKPSFSAAATSG